MAGPSQGGWTGRPCIGHAYASGGSEPGIGAGSPNFHPDRCSEPSPGPASDTGAMGRVLLVDAWLGLCILCTGDEFVVLVERFEGGPGSREDATLVDMMASMNGSLSSAEEGDHSRE